MFRKIMMLAASLAASLSVAIPGASAAEPGTNGDSLVGAWRGKVQFTSGAFVEVKDLEFMYVFHVGGTMMESSNYDSAPPVPPAYGVWKSVGPRQYEATYQFFLSKPVATAEELAKGGGWGPGGYGIVKQKMTLSADGNSFESQISFELFDPAGKPMAGGGGGVASAQRLGHAAPDRAVSKE